MAIYCERVAPAADLALLKQFLGLCPDNASASGSLAPVYHSDVLFVAIDFEGDEHKYGVSQIGVSILDTRGFPYASLLGQDLINTRLYCVSRGSKHRRSDKKTRKAFTLGEVSWITREERIGALATIFQECSSYPILEQDERLSPYTPVRACASKEARNIVLVGHALGNELKNMEMLGFDPQSCARILAHVDTQELSGQIKGHMDCTTLRSLVHRAGLRPRQIYEAGARPKSRQYHNAGNDAAYTLEVLLLLVAKEHEQAVNASQAGWIGLTKLSMMEAITLASLTLLPEPRNINLQALLELGESQSRKNLPHRLAESAIPGSRNTAAIDPEFLLAAARWQMVKQFDNPCVKAESALQAFDAHAQLVVGTVAYSRAICAMPIYSALAPPWHLHSDRP
ncbi:MAG: hypothetical protein Q9208_008796 [Pyrenodesmia sp. 3 TL-2023]